MERPVLVVIKEEEDELMAALPPGFRFHPTDEEVITHYLRKKVMDSRFTARAIAEVDLNKCEPWDLPKKANMGEKEWYFFCQRDRKYPTGMRTNRATESGYWKATGKDKEIYKGKGNLVGMKKTLVFYKGRAPKGEKSNWVMHEYRLEGKLSLYNFPYNNNKAAKKDWVVSKVFHKNTAGSMTRTSPAVSSSEVAARMDSFVGHLLECPSTLPPLMDDLANPNDARPEHSSFTNNGDDEPEFRAPNTSFNFCSKLNNQWVELPQDQKGFLAPTTHQHHHNYYSKFNSNHQASASNSTPNLTFYPQVAQPRDVNFVNQEYSSSFGSYQHHDKSTGSIPAGYNTSGCCSKGADEQQSDAVKPHLYCKREHFSSNNSMITVSQDTTGHSIDIGPPEISSSLINSKPENCGYDRSFQDFLDCFCDDHSLMITDISK